MVMWQLLWQVMWQVFRQNSIKANSVADDHNISAMTYRFEIP